MSATAISSRDAETKPLLHTWSLAVEEQYYIVFPLCSWRFIARLRWVQPGIAALARAVLRLSVLG